MDSGHGKMRQNIEVDRISSLPDDLIHTILSYIGIKPAIRTSAWSSRWRFIWTSLPYLNFSTADFSTLPEFSNFVTHVLSNRNNQIGVSSFKLSFRGKISQLFVQRIMDYALSHNVQQLNVTFLNDMNNNNNIEFPLSLFSSKSLKHFSVDKHSVGAYIKVTSRWELPALTTLYLDCITFDDVMVTDKCIDVFSKCPNLKNLTLNRCNFGVGHDVGICHPGLLNLTLEKGLSRRVLNVVAPQLKNLTIRNWLGVHDVSAPKLISLVLKGYDLLNISRKGICSLEKADLCICIPHNKNHKSGKIYAHKLIVMLQQLRNVMFLTMNLEIIQFLSTLAELITHQPSPFANLKCLKVYPHFIYPKLQETIPTEVKKYLLDSSSDATITIVSHKEMVALNNAERAQALMEEYQELIEQEKATFKTNRALMERREDLCEHINKVKAHSCINLSKMPRIESLLTDQLPSSKKAKIQARFTTLCEEADILINEILASMKPECVEKRNSLNVCFRELAKPSPPPS